MRSFIRSGASAGLAIAMTLAVSVPALAQAQVRTAPVPRATANTGSTASSDVTRQAGPGLPPVDADQTIRGTGNTQLFQVLGFSGQIAAPVNADYNADNTYQTFAGQPGRGSTAVLSESMDGSP